MFASKKILFQKIQQREYSLYKAVYLIIDRVSFSTKADEPPNWVDMIVEYIEDHGIQPADEEEKEEFKENFYEGSSGKRREYFERMMVVNASSKVNSEAD